jgi:hypothetical protein
VFKYDWSQFNIKLGLIFIAGALVVFGFIGRIADFSVMAAGISALLAWCTVIIVPDQKWKDHIVGLLAYLLFGVGLTWLAAVLLPYEWIRLGSMAVVTFLGYLVLLRGLHPFIVSWCIVYWYLLVPVFIGDGALGPVMLGHVAGTTVVLGLNLIKPVWSRATADSKKVDAEKLAELVDPEAPEEAPSVGFVVGFALVVSVTIFAGLLAGTRWLTSDPALIANATINMISPSLQQTRDMAVERIIWGTLGVCAGFYLGWYFPGPWVGNVVVIVGSFFAVGLIYVHFALVVGIVFFLISYSWGAMQSDTGRLIANERLLSELAGVLLAVIAITILTGLLRLHSRSEPE